jgi:threonine/homoserine/homoserine lactone efflux protein
LSGGVEVFYFFKGLVVGISVSAPLGPMGVLCIQRTIGNNLKSGIVSGLGASVADTFYAVIAGFGITFIANFIDQQQIAIRIIGGLFMLYLGFKIYFTNPAKAFRRQRLKQTKLFTDFITVFLLTLTNPLTIIFFGAVFAGLQLVHHQFESLVLLTSGVFAGATLWWVALGLIINKFKKNIRLRRLWWINRITGIVIVVLSFAIFLSLIFLK